LPLDALSVGAARLLLYHFLNVAGGAVEIRVRTNGGTAYIDDVTVNPAP
jgi:hypothetical protein